MRSLIYAAIISLTITSCESQTTKKDVNKIVGGPCQGCEAIFEYGEKKLTAVDTMPGFLENEPKIKITGTVFEKDERTPAKNVILYIYHTNRNGIYETQGNEEGWARRHGIYRGWAKTDADGKYTFYTFRPAAYPNRSEPEHIHITVKEPERNEYWLNAYVFSDDPLLTDDKRKGLDNRGGSGIVTPKFENGILNIDRNITLGLNIPDYE